MCQAQEVETVFRAQFLCTTLADPLWHAGSDAQYFTFPEAATVF